MATRRISVVFWITVLAAAAIFLPSENLSWAVETPTATAKGVQSAPTAPMPTSQTTGNEGRETIPAPSPMPSTDRGNPQPNPSAAPADENCDADECPNCCALPTCSPPGRYWLRTDYLMWWTNGEKLPPLVTTSPQGTPVAQAGVLPAATILYGNQTIGNDGRSGVRTTMGMRLDCCHNWDVELDYFQLGQRNYNYDSGFSTGDPILARPFFNVQTNAQASQLVAYPGQAVGTVTDAGAVEGSAAVNTTMNFYSAGVLFSHNLCCCDACGGCDSCGSCGDSCNDPCNAACCPPLLSCCRTDLLFGFRYYRLDDNLGITENLQVTQAGPTDGTRFNILDNFNAKNEFYGGELGLRTSIYRGRWSLDILGKLALGSTQQTVTIAGQTVITPPTGSATTYNAGILASGTNSGTFRNDLFTIIPQLNLELGYQINCHWRAYLGYDILYWASVAQAANQIDLNVDPRNIPPQQPGGLPFPAYPGRESSFWAQGISLGGEYRF